MSISKGEKGKMSAKYAHFARSATISAKLNAPSLMPYFLYTYGPRQNPDEPDDAFVKFLKVRDRASPAPRRPSKTDRRPRART